MNKFGSLKSIFRTALTRLSPAKEKLAAPRATWQQGYNNKPVKVSQSGDFLVGTFVSDNGKKYKTRQRIDGLKGTALCDDERAFELFLFSGQSNAGFSPDPCKNDEQKSPFAKRPWFPNHVFTTNVWWGSYGEQAPQESAITDFLACADHPEYGALPQTAFMLALESLNRVDGQAGPGYAARTDWFGDQPLSTFVQGKQQFENTLMSARVLSRISRRYNRLAKFWSICLYSGRKQW